MLRDVLGKYVIIALCLLAVTYLVYGHGDQPLVAKSVTIRAGSYLPQPMSSDTSCDPLPPHKIVSAGLSEKKFTMYIHPPTSDVHVSGSIARSGLWESHIIRQFYWPRIQQDLNTVVVDIGANIGMYSLIAAQHGLQVFGFEAQSANFNLLCNSIRANKGMLSHLTLYHAAISDKVGQVVSIKNQGDVEKSRNIGGTSFQTGEGQGSILTLTIDHALAEITGRRVVLKIDVEGMECEAFAGAQQFLHRNHIQLILMEWAQIASKCGTQLAYQFDTLGLKPHIKGLKLEQAHKWNQWDVIWIPK